jgi:hypothetical protein
LDRTSDRAVSDGPLAEENTDFQRLEVEEIESAQDNKAQWSSRSGLRSTSASGNQSVRSIRAGVMCEYIFHSARQRMVDFSRQNFTTLEWVRFARPRSRSAHADIKLIGNEPKPGSSGTSRKPEFPSLSIPHWWLRSLWGG